MTEAKLEYEKAQLEHNSIINITKNIISTNYDKFIMAQENVGYYKSIIDESKRILDLSKQKHKTIILRYILLYFYFFIKFFHLFPDITRKKGNNKVEF